MAKGAGFVPSNTVFDRTPNNRPTPNASADQIAIPPGTRRGVLSHPWTWLSRGRLFFALKNRKKEAVAGVIPSLPLCTSRMQKNSENHPYREYGLL